MESRIRLLKDLEASAEYTMDEFAEVLDREFSVFKGGKKYDYVTDIRAAYANSLSKSKAELIFETIPDHVFWDIKTPIGKDIIKPTNKYNPFRKVPFSSFFDFRENMEYNDRRERKNNLRDNISNFVRY